MPQILSFPFRFDKSGRVATVEQGSDQANREQIAVLCLTVTGERPLALPFGISDPTFSTVEPSEIRAAVAAHGPDVEVVDVRVTQESPTTAVIDVDFA